MQIRAATLLNGEDMPMKVPESIQDLRIILVDDDESIRHSLEFYFRRKGVSLVSFGTAEEALQRVQEHEAGLVITDYRLPGLNGLQFVQELNGIDPQLLKILITAYGTLDVVTQAMRLGIHDFIQKPFNAEAMESAICTLIQRRKDGSDGVFLNGCRLDQTEDLHFNNDLMSVDPESNDKDEYVSVNDVVRECVTRFRHQADEGGIDLFFNDEAAPLLVEARKSHLLGIVENLVVNSIRGLMTVKKPSKRIYLAIENSSCGRSIVISDNGNGIESAPFGKINQQASTGNTDRYGAELYIVRKLTENLGASLDIRNIPGVGTAVEVTFPWRSGTAGWTRAHQVMM
jgi:DNA-binding response OmpR family regulator